MDGLDRATLGVRVKLGHPKHFFSRPAAFDPVHDLNYLLYSLKMCSFLRSTSRGETNPTISVPCDHGLLRPTIQSECVTVAMFTFLTIL